MHALPYVCYSRGMTTTKDTSHRRPMIVATSVLVLGVAATLAGNLQAINLDNANPGVGAYISAIWWPLALFGVVELLIHTPWLANWRDRMTKGAVLVAVASVAAWVSYWHLANVLSHYGYDVASRYAGPVAIDAAMVLAALALDRVVQARRGHVSKRVDIQLATGGIVHGPRPMLWTADGVVHKPAKDTTAEVDKAISEAGQDVANEAESWLAGLASRVEDTTSTLPVPVSPAPAQGGRSAKVRLTMADGTEASELAAMGRDNGLKAGEIAELLAGWYGVSTRTIRRQPWWTGVTSDVS